MFIIGNPIELVKALLIPSNVYIYRWKTLDTKFCQSIVTMWNNYVRWTVAMSNERQHFSNGSFLGKRNFGRLFCHIESPFSLRIGSETKRKKILKIPKSETYPKTLFKTISYRKFLLRDLIQYRRLDAIKKICWKKLSKHIFIFKVYAKRLYFQWKLQSRF